MAVIKRCDGCGTETRERYPQDWIYFQVYGQWHNEEKLFCSEGCIADYYLAKRMIEGVL